MLQHEEILPEIRRDDILIWWLDTAAAQQLLGTARGYTVDLLDQLGVPPYVAHEIRENGVVCAGRVRVPREFGHIRVDLPRPAAGTDFRSRCFGVVFSRDDVSRLAHLPGWITDLSADLIPVTEFNEGFLNRRIALAIQYGCVCGSNLDMIGNRPVVIEKSRTRMKILIRCERCCRQ
jgi:hypothetical protein